MDYVKFNAEIDKYLEKIKTNSYYLKLVELKKNIYDKYKVEINRFMVAKSELEKAMEYSKYYNIDKIKFNYQEAKTNLYAKEEVKKYFSYLRKIDDLVNIDLKEIKEYFLDETNGKCQCK